MLLSVTIENMNRLRTAGVVLGVLLGAVSVAIVVTLLARQYFAGNGNTNDLHVAMCPTRRASHLVTIWQNQLHPGHTEARLCDTLTITNADAAIRLIAFGPHEHHEPYDGVTEKVLGSRQSLTLTLNQLGTYHFHDHLQDEVAGDFTVSE